jgi:hypothetical protein
MSRKTLGLLVLPLFACGLLQDPGSLTSDTASVPTGLNTKPTPSSSSGDTSGSTSSSSGASGTSSSGSSSGTVSTSSSSGSGTWTPLAALGKDPIDCGVFAGKKFCDNFQDRTQPVQGAWSSIAQMGATSSIVAATFRPETQALTVNQPAAGSNSQGFLTRTLPTNTNEFSYVFRSYLANVAFTNTPTLLGGVASATDKVNLRVQVENVGGTLKGVVYAGNQGGTKGSQTELKNGDVSLLTIRCRIVYRNPTLTFAYQAGDEAEIAHQFTIANVTAVTLGVVSGSANKESTIQFDDAILDYP